MGRARENFNSVYFKDETGAQMSFANGSYANKLRFIFWNLMDSHVLKFGRAGMRFHDRGVGKTRLSGAGRPQDA